MTTNLVSTIIASHLLLDGEDGDVHGVRVDLELDHGPELAPAWRQPQ